MSLLEDGRILLEVATLAGRAALEGARLDAPLADIDEALAASGACRAALCGPPIMLHRAAEALCRRGLAPHDVHVALERYMKCGVGRCGHCYVDGRYVCTDGPVFPYAELLRLPDAFRTEALAADVRSC